MTVYEKVKIWRKNNPEKVAAQARRYRTRHPENVKETKKRYRSKNIDDIRVRDAINQHIRRKSDPEAQRLRYKKWRDKRELSLARIAGRSRPVECELCGSGLYPIVFDHDHTTGLFRGWICDRCNKVLGLVKDSTTVLQSMIEYLENNYHEVAETNSKETTISSEVRFRDTFSA